MFARTDGLVPRDEDLLIKQEAAMAEFDEIRKNQILRLSLLAALLSLSAFNVLLTAMTLASL